MNRRLDGHSTTGLEVCSCSQDNRFMRHDQEMRKSLRHKQERIIRVDRHDLRALIRGGASDDELTQSIRSIWRRREDRYSELRAAHTLPQPKVEMSYIGG